MGLRLLPVLAVLFAAAPAFAHHPAGGMTPQTAWQGLLSGLGHPVIGLDHLAFLVAAGLIAATLPWRGAMLAIGAFVAAGAVGTLLHLAGTGLGPVELLVAGTSVVAGLVLLRGEGTVLGAGLAGAGFALAGLVHGHAFAEAVVGAETTPVLAYLVGLALVQGAIALLLAWLARDARQVRRLGGAAAALVGAASLAVALLA